jgi:antitoxin HigA-1
MLGISRQHLYDILRAQTGVSCGGSSARHLFGEGAGVWIRMPAAYDTWKAERKEDVSKTPTLRIKAA